MATPLHSHPERNSIRLQLKQNVLLAGLAESELAELAELLFIVDRHRGDVLLRQGDMELRQYFVIDGLLKRTVTSPEGREMTLCFADARGMETSHDAWQNGTCSAHSVVCVTRSRVAQLPIKDWCAFIDRHPHARQVFADAVMAVTRAIMGHAINLHLLDAPSRVRHFSCKHPELVDRLSQRELASHLNLSAETLCRLCKRPDASLRQRQPAALALQ